MVLIPYKAFWNSRVVLFILNSDIADWGNEDADDEDVSVWEDNWEDDNIQDDFNQQLR